MADDYISDTIREWREQRDRREAQRRPMGFALTPDHAEPADMQPLPPLDAYADEFQREEGQEAAAPDRASRFFTAADLEGRPVPERPWLVPDLVPSKTVTLFSGDGGTGKSLLALQLCAAVASGGAWLGLPVAQGRALMISA
ncbi:MAG: AAA family ATPase [Rhodobacteraceae bacterium]|jgi:hypothetical protein|nr:AAA family ATPase [Paracoccaceae bacterium]